MLSSNKKEISVYNSAELKHAPCHAFGGWGSISNCLFNDIFERYLNFQSFKDVFPLSNESGCENVSEDTTVCGSTVNLRGQLFNPKNLKHSHSTASCPSSIGKRLNQPAGERRTPWYQ